MPETINKYLFAPINIQQLGDLYKVTFRGSSTQESLGLLTFDPDQYKLGKQYVIDVREFTQTPQTATCHTEFVPGCHCDLCNNPKAQALYKEQTLLSEEVPSV